MGAILGTYLLAALEGQGTARGIIRARGERGCVYNYVFKATASDDDDIDVDIGRLRLEITEISEHDGVSDGVPDGRSKLERAHP